MMNTQTYKHALTTMLGSLLASFLCMSGLVIAQEIEPNDSSITAQSLVIPADGVSVTCMMGSASSTSTTDLDLFWFDAMAGDVPNIMVVTDATWDSLLVLYDASGQILVQNDDAVTPNPGSQPFSGDSRIDDYALGATGRYYVAVTSYPRYLGPGFMPLDASTLAMTGAYTLTVSGITGPASPPDVLPDPGPVGGDDVQAITIEVRHWSGSDEDVSKRWKRRMKRMGKRRGIYPVPVVMLSSERFDPMSIDESSLNFGATGEEDSMFRCSKHARDINGDGMNDKMCFFDAFKTDFGVGDVQGFLNGKTKDGQAFKSSASLKVFSIEKGERKGWHKRHNVDHRGNNERGNNKRSNRRHHSRSKHND